MRKSRNIIISKNSRFINLLKKKNNRISSYASV